MTPATIVLLLKIWLIGVPVIGLIFAMLTGHHCRTYHKEFRDLDPGLIVGLFVCAIFWPVFIVIGMLLLILAFVFGLFKGK